MRPNDISLTFRPYIYLVKRVQPFCAHQLGYLVPACIYTLGHTYQIEWQHEGVYCSEDALRCCAACNISLYYYAGFCYLLLRRYTDAARTFNIILNYISRWASEMLCFLLEMPVPVYF